MADPANKPTIANTAASAAAEDSTARGGRKIKITLPGYKLGNVIARGGQAIVIKAVQESSGKAVAIKLLREGPLADSSARARLQREISVLASLNHPNIVAIIDNGTTAEGMDYLVMNFIAGQPLSEFIQQQGGTEATKSNPASASLLKLFTKICSAMNAAHLRGVVHRDLSPSNIMVDLGGEPHILDFGLARTAFDRFLGGGDRTISTTGTFMGKLSYASPEQARGESDKIDIRTDVYALGIILYQIITGGEFPYKVDGNVVEALGNIVNQQPTPPSKRIAVREAQLSQEQRRLRQQHPPAVNDVLEAIVMKSLEKDPANRYQTAGELGRDVENYLAGMQTVAQVKSRYGFSRSAPARPASMPEPSGAVLTHRLAVAGLFLSVLVGCWAIYHFLNADSTPEAPAPTQVAGVHGPMPNELPATPSPPVGPVASLPPLGPGHPASSGPAEPPATKVGPSTAALLPTPGNAGPGILGPLATRPIPPAVSERPIDLLAQIKLPDDALHGKWKKTDEGIETSAGLGQLKLSYTPQGEYDFGITFTCKNAKSAEGRNHHAICQVLSYNGQDFGWVLGFDNCWFAQGSTPHVKPGIEAGKKHTCVVKVRRDSVAAYLDDEMVTSMTDFSELRTAGGSGGIPSGTLALITFENTTVFHAIEVVPIGPAGPGAPAIANPPGLPQPGHPNPGK
jgi:serine/threonine protein kinase